MSYVTYVFELYQLRDLCKLYEFCKLYDLCKLYELCKIDELCRLYELRRQVILFFFREYLRMENTNYKSGNIVKKY